MLDRGLHLSVSVPVHVALATELSSASPTAASTRKPSRADASSQSSGYRPEIDGLRAVAVLAVILFHVDEQWLPGGLHGVDVFFVISGYVISGFLSNSRALDWKAFLVNFYAKRAKRLFPALLWMVLVTSVSILLLINPTTTIGAYSLKTGAAALVSLSNIYLWLIRFDYFGLNAQLNFFSHTWSLGVEEQFYMLFPIVLLLAGFTRITSLADASRVRKVLLVLSISSFGLFLYTAAGAGAFYLMPARFWELGLGSLAFLYAPPARIALVTSKKTRSGAYSLDMGLVLLAGLAIPSAYRLYSLPLVALCTFGLLFYATAPTYVYRLLSSKAMVGTGKLSYSLYLWHWPILLVFGYKYGSARPPGLVAALLVVIFAVSALSYLAIEKPLRYRKWAAYGGREIAMAVSAAVGIACIVFFAGNSPEFKRNFYLGHDSFDYSSPTIRGTTVSQDNCNFPVGGRYMFTSEDVARCSIVQSASSRTVFFMGDSHANALRPLAGMLASQSHFNVDVLTMGGCPFAITVFVDYGRKDCPEFNKSQADRILGRIKRGDVLVIAASWLGYFSTSPRNRNIGSVSFHRGGRSISRAEALKYIAEDFVEISRVIGNRGGALVVVAPTPRFNNDSPSCESFINLSVSDRVALDWLLRKDSVLQERAVILA